MSVARTARRRRAQAKKGYRHIAPMDRPHYRAKSAEKSTRQQRQFDENRKRGLKAQ